jgi:hypothetical protein
MAQLAEHQICSHSCGASPDFINRQLWKASKKLVPVAAGKAA